MTTPTLMIQGTTSNAGKSTLVTGLCRALYRRGIRVAPFKPQNMALNSAVTTNGGEIGRAQAVQAQACGIDAHTDMNPVLLKPTSSTGSQVIIQGKVHATMRAQEYHQFKSQVMDQVMASYLRLCQRFDAIVVEGAGSPAEINLRQHDIANMGFAEAADCPVILVSDIEPGGVFAHIVGTLELLSESESQRVKGIVINRFRGDLSLLKPGLVWLEQRTGLKVLGVMPHLDGLHLEAEDSFSLNARSRAGASDSPKPVNGQPINAPGDDRLAIAVPYTPHISNHTDFDPLALNAQVNFQFVKDGETIPDVDLIILPGSKNVSDDLAWLRRSGWEKAILRHLRYGGKLIGICGGFQMLGKHLHDPLGIESSATTFAGLGLLDLETTFQPQKKLAKVTGYLQIRESGGPFPPVSGYEIHMGVSTGPALGRPLLVLDHGVDGAISDDNQIIGTYVHGLFDQPDACCALLKWAGLEAASALDFRELCNRNIDRVADAVESHLNLDYIGQLLGIAPLAVDKFFDIQDGCKAPISS